jgi:hypothetical protein
VEKFHQGNSFAEKRYRRNCHHFCDAFAVDYHHYLIQDSTFKNLEGSKIPIIFIDNDKSEISQNIKKSRKW